MSPLRQPLPSMIGSFSILNFLSISCASSSVVPSGAVTRFSLVIAYLIFLEKSVSKRKSLFVMMPLSLPSSSVIGTPLILYLPMSSSASARVCSSDSLNGSIITPCSLLFTLSTSVACCSIVIFLCIIPMPPSRAIVIAMEDSVTVSIAALISGMFN